MLGGHGEWVQCKHMYHILQNITYCRQIEKLVHYPPRIGTRFNVCWHMLKHVRANDVIIKLDLHQFL